ncbi:serine/threonine-protein kinase [Ideonella livida]|uniref:Serine/threonine protein kinase n=1 Tax=Ideonella livida TaxID=2707176 RepID=A0A7C9TLK5_9BURK|nr:serine/threonine-protein kinase [Ideonella livida]NDY91026.1 serine/threonine protein kinase [Ideonella livida]
MPEPAACPPTPAGYRLVALAGQGGQAQVFQAVQLSSGRPVALKMAWPPGGRDDGSHPTGLTRERLVLQRLGRQDGIACLLDHGQLPAAPQRPPTAWLAIEWLDGPRLTQVLSDADRRLTPYDLTGLVDTLARLHAQGVVHGDLHPDNVLQSLDGRQGWCLTDFGNAAAPGIAPLRHASVLQGRLDWLAPEQVLGHSPTPATDVHALGWMLASCLGVVRPAACVGLVQQLRRQNLAAPPVWPAELSVTWRELLSRMLHPKPRARPSAQEVASLLRDTR